MPQPLPRSPRTSPSPWPPQRLRLQPGQQQAWYLPAGSTVQVGAGRVSLQAPVQWLADQMLQPRLTLAGGVGHRLAQGGWVQLQALGDRAAVVWVLPAPPGAHARRGLALWQGLQRLCRPKRLQPPWRLWRRAPRSAAVDAA